jgi:hypothetical protein
MATFTFRFNEVAQNQVWFEATDEEHAKALMQQVIDEEINADELPNVQERNRGIYLDFEVSYIESAS